MTKEELVTFAQGVAAGGPFKKSDIVAFMKTYLELQNPTAAPQDVNLPHLAFDIEKTDSGIHVPREANRFYDHREGLALLAKLAEALK